MPTHKLSEARIYRMKEQGYTTQTDAQLSALAFGNRFAYRLCTVLLSIGVVTANIPVLSVMLLIAFAGGILPHHPFDYIYNHLLAKRLNKPQLPKRAIQLKFTCTLATAWIGITICLFATGNMIAGYIMGSLLMGVALLVGTTDICIPSIIFNVLFLKGETPKT